MTEMRIQSGLRANYSGECMRSGQTGLPWAKSARTIITDRAVCLIRSARGRDVLLAQDALHRGGML
jgi:hypothetical protein